MEEEARGKRVKNASRWVVRLGMMLERVGGG